MSKKNATIVVAYPGRGAGNDPFFFFFFFFFWGGVGGGGSLSPPRLSIFTVGNMGVMICLGQGGLRSLSVSSSTYFLYKIVKGARKVTSQFFLKMRPVFSAHIPDVSSIISPSFANARLGDIYDISTWAIKNLVSFQKYVLGLYYKQP